MKDSNTYIQGDWNVICPVCSFKYKASDMVQRWDGQMVCKPDWDPYHPQNLVRGVPDNQQVPWTKPRQEDVFITNSPEPDDYGHFLS